jgi:hypothetical protein
VARRHALETIVDLLLVARADAAVEHDLAVPVGHIATNTAVLVAVVCGAEAKALRNHGLADCEEVRAQSANEPFDEDLEDGGGDESVEQADGGVVDVPEAAGADLDDEKDGEGDEEGHKCGRPDRYNLFHVSLCTLYRRY